MINILFLGTKFMQPENVFQTVSAMLTRGDLFQAENMKDIVRYEATPNLSTNKYLHYFTAVQEQKEYAAKTGNIHL